ncbi:hypothetical protein QUA43_19290 [Microcoleus sp. N9_B4]
MCDGLRPATLRFFNPCLAGFVCVDAVSTAGVGGLMDDINIPVTSESIQILCVTSGWLSRWKVLSFAPLS